MNEERVKEGLKLILSAFSEEKFNKVIDPVKEPTKELAVAIADVYQTFHPEYSAEVMYKDLKAVSASVEKYGFLVSWLKKANYSFPVLQLPRGEKQQKEIQKAILENETVIKSILNQRFHG